MNEEDLYHCLARYRSAARDDSTPALDQVILRAARRQSFRKHAVRRTGFTLAVLAIVSGVYWNPHLVRTPQVRTDAGMNEGATRYFLSNVSGAAYSGSGSMEHAP